MANRENILNALFALLQTAGPFPTASRRVGMVQDIVDFPALFLVSTGTQYERPQVRGLPSKRTLDVQVWIYSDVGKDTDTVPETAMNTLLDAVEVAMAPSVVSGVQTLGNQVSHAWIEGEAELFPGVLDGIAMAIVPIKILIP